MMTCIILSLKTCQMIEEKIEFSDKSTSFLSQKIKKAK